MSSHLASRVPRAPVARAVAIRLAAVLLSVLAVALPLGGDLAAAAATTTSTSTSAGAQPGPPPGSSSIAYLALTFDGRTLALYVNGRLAASHAEPGPADQGAPASEIGAYSASEWWNGAIDEVAVYRRALPPQTVAAHYATGTSDGATYPALIMSTAGVVDYWRLGDPRRITDAVGHASGSPTTKGIVGWYSLITGSRNRAMALNGFGAEVRLAHVPTLRTFSVEAWVLPGPQVGNRTIVSRPGAWVLKTDIFGRWNGAFFHRRRIVGVTAKSRAVPPRPAAQQRRRPSHASKAGSGGTSPVVFIVILLVIAAAAASVPLRRRQRQPPERSDNDAVAPPSEETDERTTSAGP